MTSLKFLSRFFFVYTIVKFVLFRSKRKNERKKKFIEEEEKKVIVELMNECTANISFHNQLLNMSNLIRAIDEQIDRC